MATSPRDKRDKYAPTIVLVTLDCGHTVEYRNPAPTIGQRVYCRPCGDWRDVTVIPDIYRASCRECTFRCSYGLDRDRVLAASSKHVLRRPHIVDVFHGKTIVDTVAPDAGQGSLPFQTSLNERQTVSRDAQKALRNYLGSLPNRYDPSA